MVHAWAHARGRMVAACELDAPPAGFARAVSPAPGGRDTASAPQHSGRALDLERMALVMCGFLLGAGAGRPASSLSMPWQAESSGARATAVELYVGKKPCWLGVSVQENDGLSLLPPLPFSCLFFYLRTFVNQGKTFWTHGAQQAGQKRTSKMSLVFDEYGRPFIILKEQEKKSRLKGIAALKANIMAARSVASTLRSSLGPKGMDKILVSGDGEVCVSNDGATILERMEVGFRVPNSPALFTSAVRAPCC